jgi:uncharacterized membrane protein YidH (DUF202 family)
VATVLFALAVGIGYVSIRFLLVVFTAKAIGDLVIGIGVAIFLFLVVARLIILALWRYQVGASANDLADGIEACSISHDEDRGTP